MDFDYRITYYDGKRHTVVRKAENMSAALRNILNEIQGKHIDRVKFCVLKISLVIHKKNCGVRVINHNGNGNKK